MILGEPESVKKTRLRKEALRRDGWGYDTFLRYMCGVEKWGTYLAVETSQLKHALKVRNKITGDIDASGITEVSQITTDKIAQIIRFTKTQTGEIESLLESCIHTELLMPQMNFSGRVLRSRPGEDEVGYQKLVRKQVAADGGERSPLYQVALDVKQLIFGMGDND